MRLESQVLRLKIRSRFSSYGAAWPAQTHTESQGATGWVMSWWSNVAIYQCCIETFDTRFSFSFSLCQFHASFMLNVSIRFHKGWLGAAGFRGNRFPYCGRRLALILLRDASYLHGTGWVHGHSLGDEGTVQRGAQHPGATGSTRDNCLIAIAIPF
jgi:hypothetical protein